MGHSDSIVLADANFPVGMFAREPGLILLRADGLGIPELLDAVLSLMPLDKHTVAPVTLMERMECDMGMDIAVWREYEKIVAKHDERGADIIVRAERFDFYKLAKAARCIVHTGETAVYANIMLQKGVI
jgi:L-fucose mutarotase